MIHNLKGFFASFFFVVFVFSVIFFMFDFVNFFDVVEASLKAQIIITSYFFRVMRMFFSQGSFFKLFIIFEAMFAEKQKRAIQKLNALQLIRDATTKQIVFFVKFNRETSETNNRISISTFRKFNFDGITRFENISSSFVMRIRSQFSHDIFDEITQFDEITFFMLPFFISRKIVNVSDSFFLVVKLSIRVTESADRIIFEFVDSIENEFVDVRGFSGFGPSVERHVTSGSVDDVDDLMMTEINDLNENDDEEVRPTNKKRKLIKKKIIFFFNTRSKLKKNKKKQRTMKNRSKKNPTFAFINFEHEKKIPKKRLGRTKLFSTVDCLKCFKLRLYCRREKNRICERCRQNHEKCIRMNGFQPHVGISIGQVQILEKFRKIVENLIFLRNGILFDVREFKIKSKIFNAAVIGGKRKRMTGNHERVDITARHEKMMKRLLTLKNEIKMQINALFFEKCLC